MRFANCDCPVDCDDAECESVSADSSGSSVAVGVVVTLKCYQCGIGFKSRRFDEIEEIGHTCSKIEPEPEFDIISKCDPEPTLNHHKNFIGFSQEVTVRCLTCNEEIIVTVAGECPVTELGQINDGQKKPTV
jgi:hypothetical protein